MTSNHDLAADAASRYAVIAASLLAALENQPDASATTRQRAAAIRRTVPLQPATTADVDMLRRAASTVAELKMQEEMINGWIAEHHLDTARQMLDAARQMVNGSLTRDWPDN